MRLTHAFAALLMLMPGHALASVPGQIVPRAGFLPLHQARPAIKLPARGAKFLPLPPRGQGVMLPLRTDSDLPTEAKLPPRAPSDMSEAEAKLLLSIFGAGD